MKETQLLKQILDFCRHNDLLFYRTQAGMVKTDRGGFMKFGSAGVADITGCVDGRFIAVECKIGKNKQQLSQSLFEKKVLEKGGEYWLIYNLEDFINKFNKSEGRYTVC